MKNEDITHKIIGAAYKVFNTLGFGFLESVYKKAMIIDLTNAGLKVEAEKLLRVYYGDEVVGEFSADLFVELKSVQNLVKEHACPVKCLPRAMLLAFYCTGAFLLLFNWGGAVSQLS